MHASVSVCVCLWVEVQVGNAGVKGKGALTSASQGLPVLLPNVCKTFLPSPVRRHRRRQPSLRGLMRPERPCTCSAMVSMGRIERKGESALFALFSSHGRGEGVSLPSPLLGAWPFPSQLLHSRLSTSFALHMALLQGCCVSASWTVASGLEPRSNPRLPREHISASLLISIVCCYFAFMTRCHARCLLFLPTSFLPVPNFNAREGSEE